MTQREFESLSGMKITAEQYAKVERAYMAAENVDKQQFCSEWPSLAASEVVQDLTECIESRQAEVKRLAAEKADAIHSLKRAHAALNDAMVELDGARKELEDAQAEARKLADRCSALMGAMLERGMEEEAIKAAGHRAVVVYKCRHLQDLTAEDRTLIIEALEH